MQGAGRRFRSACSSGGRGRLIAFSRCLGYLKGCRRMLGAIAEAHYRTIPEPILRQVRKRLSKPLWQTALEFTRKFGIEEIVARVESLEAE